MIGRHCGERALNPHSQQAHIGAPARRRLGQTDLAVSSLGLGGAQIGGRRGAVDAEQVRALIDELFGWDLNLIDTAARYRNGRAEKELGSMLSAIPRADYVVSTKLTPARNGIIRSTAAAIAAAVETSTVNLQCGKLDIALLHDPEDLASAQLIAELDALVAARVAGTVRAVGVGVDDINTLLEAVENSDIDCVLVSGRYTLLDQSAADRLLPLCVQRGVGVILGSAFHSGVLATGGEPGGRYAYGPIPAPIADKVAVLTQTCAEHGISLLAAALQFPLANPAIASVVVGTARAEHLADCCAALDEPIPLPFWDALRERGLISARAVVPGEA
jgi:D-threo-aldose 1-dehydrogenase